MIINGKEYVINRSLARISEWDNIYCQIIKDVLKRGELCENRTGIDTLSIPNISFSLDLSKQFPIMEIKELAIKNTITELLWIYQVKSNIVAWLKERGNPVWNEWMIDEDGIYRTYDPYIKTNTGESVDLVDLDGKVIPNTKATSLHADKTIKSAKYFGKEFAGTIGTCYGGQLNITNEFDINVLQKLKNNPNDRRKNVNLLQQQFMKTAVLPTCVWSSTYKKYLNKLYLTVDVRSNDMPLGNPFNVTQYAILQSLVAHVSGLKVGTLDWRISDCHIYVNQIDGIKEQIERYEKLQYWEHFINTSSDEDVEYMHGELVRQRDVIEIKSRDEKFTDTYKTIKKDVVRNLATFEHLITRENPILYLNPSIDDFYAFDNQKENKDIKVLKYTSLDKIKMPIAQ